MKPPVAAPGSRALEAQIAGSTMTTNSDPPGHPSEPPHALRVLRLACPPPVVYLDELGEMFRMQDSFLGV